MTTLGQAALAAVALLFMLSAPAFLSEHQIHILIQILFFAYLSSCWNILGGFTGQLSFGHALFLAVGAYTSTLLLLQLGVSPWIGMLAGGTLAGALGLFIGYLSFRYGIKGTFFVLLPSRSRKLRASSPLTHPQLVAHPVYIFPFVPTICGTLSL